MRLKDKTCNQMRLHLSMFPYHNLHKHCYFQNQPFLLHMLYTVPRLVRYTLLHIGICRNSSLNLTSHIC